MDFLEENRNIQIEDSSLLLIDNRLVTLINNIINECDNNNSSKIQFLVFHDKLVIRLNGKPLSLKYLQNLESFYDSNTKETLPVTDIGKSNSDLVKKIEIFKKPSKYYATYLNHLIDEIKSIDASTQINFRIYNESYSSMIILSFDESLSLFNNPSATNKFLDNIDISLLIFSRNVQSVEIFDLQSQNISNICYSLKSTSILPNFTVCTLSKYKSDTNRTESEIYLKFNKQLTKYSKQETYGIAFALNSYSNNGFEFKSTNYIPYSSPFFKELGSSLNFILYYSHRLDPTTGTTSSENVYVQLLSNQLAQLLQDAILQLRNSGNCNYSLINILPLDEDLLSHSTIYSALNQTSCHVLREEAVFLCRDNTYAYAEELIIAGEMVFFELFNDELLSELIGDGNTYHWLPYSSHELNRKFGNLFHFLTSKLSVNIIGISNFADCLKENKQFLVHRDNDWLIQFYTKLGEKIPSAFSKSNSDCNLLEVPIIKTNKGEFVPAYRKTDFNNSDNKTVWSLFDYSPLVPNVYLPPESNEIDDFLYVDKEIYNKCKSFFKNILQLSEPDEFQIFQSQFINRYGLNPTFTEEEHIQDIEQLLKFRKDSSHYDAVNILIQKYLVLRCIRNGLIQYVNPYKEIVYLPLNSDGESIEDYFKNIGTYNYVDNLFYESYNFSCAELKTLGARDNIAIDENVTSGIYVSSVHGKNLKWHTLSSFRWKLSLPKLKECLTYISSHPKDPNSIAKSAFIFHFLEKNESKLKGTVYLSNSEELNNEYSNIIKKLRYPEKYYGTSWNGKWLYTKFMQLVSQMEISKDDLNTQIYGRIDSKSTLFDILGFIKTKNDLMEESTKDYDKLTNQQKNIYFDIELHRRYGIDSDYLHYLIQKNQSSNNENKMINFPTSNCISISNIKTYAAKELFLLNPHGTNELLEQALINQPQLNALILYMYRISNSDTYACQMCHDTFQEVEVNPIIALPESTPEAMNLCLCAKCAVRYRNQFSLKDKKFILSKIKCATDDDILSHNTFQIPVEGQSIWFTQNHIALIREFLHSLQSLYILDYSSADIIENHQKVLVQNKDNSLEEVNLYKRYIGKRVRHRFDGEGIIQSCDSNYIEIQFDRGPKSGKCGKYSINICISKNLIKLLE